MHTVGLQEAAGRLAALIDNVASGEEVGITRDDGATFKIIPVTPMPLSPKFDWAGRARLNTTSQAGRAHALRGAVKVFLLLCRLNSPGSEAVVRYGV